MVCDTLSVMKFSGPPFKRRSVEHTAEDSLSGTEAERNPNIWKTLFIHEEEFKLVLMSPKDLGFDESPLVVDFFSQAKKSGLAVCPPETGGLLFQRLLDGTDDPEDDTLFIMTDGPSDARGPATPTDDSLPVFSVPVEEIRGRAAGELSEDSLVVPERKKEWVTEFVPSGTRWVFALRK